MLHVLAKGQTLVFDSEDETDVLAQFLLYEILQGREPIILHHLEKRGTPRSVVQEELFRGIPNSFSSLFRIETIRRDGVVLCDLLTQDHAPQALVDLGLIQTAKRGFLLFTRLLPLREYAITAGVSFPFGGHHAEALIKEDLKLKKLARHGEVSMRRYILFHGLAKTIGLPMEFDESTTRV